MSKRAKILLVVAMLVALTCGALLTFVPSRAVARPPARPQPWFAVRQWSGGQQVRTYFVTSWGYDAAWSTGTGMSVPVVVLVNPDGTQVWVSGTFTIEEYYP